MKPDLLIISATDVEVSHFLSSCPHASEKVIRTGQKVYSGTVEQRSYDLLVTGPGVFNTVHAMATYLGQTPDPGVVLDTGIAGVFDREKTSLGDIGIATKEHYIHTGVQSGNIQNDPLPFELINGQPQTRQGIYLMDEKRTGQVQKQVGEKIFGDQSRQVLSGPFVTVSTITASFDHADRLSSAHCAVMESMEGAACAHVCACHGLPMVELRAASNYVGERDKSKWEMDTAMNNLGRALLACF